MEIKELHKLFLESNAVTTDTRKIDKDDIFFALKGENFNGNLFAEQALNLGAKYAVIDEKDYQIDNRFILVENVLQTLQELATFHRNYLSIPVLALTGSNGKTTTKELINAVLSKKFKTSATKGNLNNHIGVPLTLLSMNEETEIGIVEMGANHHHEIETLSKIAQPNYGLITNFGKAHLEGFGSLEGVVKAKSELYDYLIGHQGTIFVNLNDKKQLEQVGNYSKIVTFGPENAEFHIQLMDFQTYVQVKFQDEIIQSSLTGEYNFNNIAVAIAIGSYFEIPLKDIKSAIENYIPTNNRSQIILNNSNKVLMDAYNANPTSMMAAIDNFSKQRDDFKLAFLGDMFELGDSSHEEHQAIINHLEKSDIEEIIVVGKNFFGTKVSSKKIKKFETFEELSQYLKSISMIGKFILIKGSRGMKLERILDLIN